MDQVLFVVILHTVGFTLVYVVKQVISSSWSSGIREGMYRMCKIFDGRNIDGFGKSQIVCQNLPYQNFTYTFKRI